MRRALGGPTTRGQRAAVAVLAFLLLLVADVFPARSPAEHAAQPTAPAAGQLDAGDSHTCALTASGVRCWGSGRDGELGYGTAETVGDEESPSSVGPVRFGSGLTVKAISAGDYHTCAVLTDGTVRCWGFGGDGRLGYANQANVTDPAAVGPVDLGPGRTAVAISAGDGHTCAVLDDGSVRCWGFGGNGRLGYGSTRNVGDDETPGAVGPVDLGIQRTATAITAGQGFTCALLDDASVRCWGFARDGRLGRGETGNDIGDNETPASAGAVGLGAGRTASAISAGGSHACAVLDDGSVRCWGFGGNGRLGYANTSSIGDDENPGSVGPVDLGAGRTAEAISVGDAHTCAVLDDGSVRCWGYGSEGRLGYASTEDVGDDEAPGSVGPVDLGAGRTAVAISAGARHTCARLDDGSVRCWGYGGDGRLGYCNAASIGDDETPGSAGPVALETGSVGAGCRATPLDSSGPPSPAASGPPSPAATPGARPPQGTGKTVDTALQSQAVRAQKLRGCLAGVARGPRRRAHAGRRRCLRVYGRTPGRVTRVRAHALSRTQIRLEFDAPGTDATHPPPARSYLIRQSPRPIRSTRDAARAHALCRGTCRFAVNRVGEHVALTITHLRPRHTYHYIVAARDNVSARPGPRSRTAAVRTR